MPIGAAEPLEAERQAQNPRACSGPVEQREVAVYDKLDMPKNMLYA